MKKIISPLFVALTLLMSVSAQAKQYCHEPLTQGDNTIYLTCEKLSEGHYQYVIEADVELVGLGGSFCNVNGAGGYQLNAPGHFVLSDDKHKITCAIESNADPNLYTPLYVLMPGEVNFGEIRDIEWGLCNADQTEYTITLVQPMEGGTIAASAAKATYGTEIVLTATPDAGKQLDKWLVKDADANELAVKKGKFVMPAANVTVTASFKDEVTLSPATFTGTSVQDVATFEWSVTRNADQTLTFAISWNSDLEGVSPQVNINNNYIGMQAQDKGATYTTTDTFEDGDKLPFFFYIAYTGNAARIDVDYTVGESNTASGVSNVTRAPRAMKMIKNGKLVIISNGQMYNANGVAEK